MGLSFKKYIIKPTESVEIETDSVGGRYFKYSLILSRLEGAIKYALDADGNEIKDNVVLQTELDTVFVEQNSIKYFFKRYFKKSEITDELIEITAEDPGLFESSSAVENIKLDNLMQNSIPPDLFLENYELLLFNLNKTFNSKNLNSINPIYFQASLIEIENFLSIIVPNFNNLNNNFKDNITRIASIAEYFVNILNDLDLYRIKAENVQQVFCLDDLNINLAKTNIVNYIRAFYINLNRLKTLNNLKINNFNGELNRLKNEAVVGLNEFRQRIVYIYPNDCPEPPPPPPPPIPKKYKYTTYYTIEWSRLEIATKFRDSVTTEEIIPEPSLPNDANISKYSYIFAGIIATRTVATEIL